MAAINLPNLSLPSNIEEGLNNKETMNEILDTLQLYRKELNFLLMNLGPDNMPSIIGKIEDGEGNISDIFQSIDEISLTVGNNAGDISQLQVKADQISAKVANNSGDISSLTIRANSIETTVANQAGDISSIKQTANAIQSTVISHTGEISSIKQTANGIQSQVTNQAGLISSVTQTVSGIQSQVSNNVNRISQVNQTIDGIQSTVAYQGNQLGYFRSDITQMSDKIESKVSYRDYNGVEIASLINQEARRITISAEALDLRGVTSIHGDYNSEAKFDRYGDFTITHGYNRVFSIYNGYDYVDLGGLNGTFLRIGGASRRTAPQGTWDFSNATVLGLR